MLIACGGGDGDRSPAVPSPTATPVDLGPPEPQVERILQHIEAFSVDIGSRLAGSPEEAEAAAYAREQFESWGYRVEVQPFSASDARVVRFADLDVEEPEERGLAAIAFGGSGLGEVSGPLVEAGTGREEDFSAEVAGAIVLIQRQDVFFTDMERRARQAGAAGVIVANKEPRLFRGTVEPAGELPIAGVSQDDGEALRTLLAAGPAEVRLSVPSEVRGSNVFARPPSGRCRTLTGGHYDTVPWADSATDNASGSAVVLELARVTAAAGLTEHCFMLFGAEEEGLVGSRHFVSQLSEQERADLEAVITYDVVAGDTELVAIGDDGLVQQAVALGQAAGQSVRVSMLPEGASSDFASFLDAGLPALMLTVDDFGIIHTPLDTFENLRPEPLGPAAELGLALLREVGQAPPP